MTRTAINGVKEFGLQTPYTTNFVASRDFPSLSPTRKKSPKDIRHSALKKLTSSSIQATYSLLFFHAFRCFSRVTSLIIERVRGSRGEQTLVLRLKPSRDGAELSKNRLLYDRVFDCQSCYYIIVYASARYIYE